jgi:hypothetical protein
LTGVRYGEIWRDLDREAATEPAPVLVKRLVEAGGGAELHLAVDSAHRKRYLMVRMADDWDEDTTGFPRWKGARIGPLRGSERPVPHRFLVVEQGEESPADVFEVLVADVVDAALSRQPGEDLRAVVATRLDRWKAFFEERGLAGLGPEAQQGLFGELWFLREHLAPKVGFPAAVSAWDVTHRAVHDFQFPLHAFEVKTSSAKQHQRFHVASERQLDTTGLDSLHVVVVSLSLLQAGGETLPGLVATIRASLVADPQTARLFEDKLLDEGYIETHADLYKTGYAFRSIRTYRVGPGFPRVLESDLKPGVGDVTYSVMLSACEAFKIRLEEALAVLGTGTAEVSG